MRFSVLIRKIETIICLYLEYDAYFYTESQQIRQKTSSKYQQQPPTQTYYNKKMKLSFTNKKQNKNCLHFIRALHDIEKHNLKDSKKPVFLYASKEQLRLAPSLADLHRERIQDGCLIVMKSDVYTLTFDQPVSYKILLLSSHKLLKALTKNDSKVGFVQLKLSNRGIVIEYQTQGGDVICHLNVQGEELEESWPEHPLSARQSNFDVVDVCKLSDAEIRMIDMKDQQELWLELSQNGLCFRSLNGKVRKQGKLQLKQNAEYKYMMVKNKLQNRVFMNLRGQFFLGHLWRCLKKKRTAIIHLKNIFDRYMESQIRQSYIVLETKLEYGTIFKVIGCFISEQMGEQAEQNIRRQIQRDSMRGDKQHQKQSYLLKAQESNSQQVRNIVLNRFNQVDGQAIIAEELYRERKPLGKIEEGQETFTRKFRSGF